MLDYTRQSRHQQGSIIEAVHSTAENKSNAATEKRIRQTDDAYHPDDARMVCGSQLGEEVDIRREIVCRESREVSHTDYGSVVDCVAMCIEEVGWQRRRGCMST